MKKYTLKELRQKNNMTLQQVADKMGGVSRQMVYQWENGYSIPSLPTIKGFLKLYGVKFEQVQWECKNGKDK